MRFVIAGGGLAAASAVEELRTQGYDGDIVVHGAEPHLPYNRPPLSKAVLLGEEEPDSVFVHDQGWYDEHGVRMRLAAPIVSIDPAGRHVMTDDGPVGYDKLLLATGATPRHLEMADRSGAKIAYLRNLEDNALLRETLRQGLRVVVVGGGWIGLEVTAAAVSAGAGVTLVEVQQLPLLGVLGPEIASVFADLHRSHDVDLRLGTTVEEVSTDPSGKATVRLGDGSSVAADLLVVGIGVAPNTSLAEEAGLAVDDGVLADATLHTSAEHVFAAGDVANAEHPVLGRRIRVEHWDTAIEQGRVAARNMLGPGEEYTRLPYFFTDQYDLGMEYVGSVGPKGYDEVVVRGSLEERLFTAFWLQGGRVLAAMHVNDWDAIDPIRGLVGTRPDRQRLADDSVPLGEIARP